MILPQWTGIVGTTLKVDCVLVTHYSLWKSVQKICHGITRLQSLKSLSYLCWKKASLNQSSVFDANLTELAFELVMWMDMI
jgi:hypothetical protein